MSILHDAWKRIQWRKRTQQQQQQQRKKESGRRKLVAIVNNICMVYGGITHESYFVKYMNRKSNEFTSNWIANSTQTHRNDERLIFDRVVDRLTLSQWKIESNRLNHHRESSFALLLLFSLPISLSLPFKRPQFDFRTKKKHFGLHSIDSVPQIQSNQIDETNYRESKEMLQVCCWHYKIEEYMEHEEFERNINGAQWKNNNNKI